MKLTKIIALGCLMLMPIMAKADIVSSPKVSQLRDVSITSLSNGECLVYNSATEDWENASCGGGSSVITTQGDLIIGDVSGAESRIGIGTNGQVLQSNGTTGVWATLTSSDVGLGNVENTALSTWAGSSNITTLGTIGTGTWNGDDIGVTYIDGSAGSANDILQSDGTDASWVTNVTLGGTLTVTSDAQFNTEVGFDAIPTVTYNSTTTTVDWGDGNTQTMTFGAGNIATLAFTDPSAVGQTVKLKLIQDGTGSRTVTAWDSDIQWCNGGDAPTLSTAASSEDWVTCIFTNTGAGNRYDCCASLDFQ